MKIRKHRHTKINKHRHNVTIHIRLQFLAAFPFLDTIANLQFYAICNTRSDHSVCSFLASFPFLDTKELGKEKQGIFFKVTYLQPSISTILEKGSLLFCIVVFPVRVAKFYEYQTVKFVSILRDAPTNNLLIEDKVKEIWFQ